MVIIKNSTKGGFIKKIFLGLKQKHFADDKSTFAESMNRRFCIKKLPALSGIFFY